MTCSAARLTPCVGVLLALLGGCGGGGDAAVADDSSAPSTDGGSGGDAPGTDEPGEGDGGSGSSLTDGPPPDVPLAADTVRALAVDVAELNDALHFLAALLPAEIRAADGACEGGGEGAASDGAAGRRVAFDDCGATLGEGIRLDGVATLGVDEGAETIALDGLRVRSGVASVEADGTLLATRDGDALDIELAGDPLRVDDSQGVLVVTDLDATLPLEPFAGEARFGYALESSRAGASVVVSTDGTLAFDGTVGCPEGGTLVLTLDDARRVRLAGATGGNVALGGDVDDDTIACTEIGRLVPARSGFTPPPAPGN